jgi:disulfide oxidoreductase YuzD
MHQFIYALAALGLTMILSLNLSNGARRTAQSVFINEAATQLSGVAYDVLEDIERAGIAFDKETDESRHPKPVMFPLVKTSGELTPVAQFGGCVDFDACRDVDDFDGLQITRTTQNHVYLIDFSVRYVDESNPTEVASTQTFAKRISAKVTHPSIMINGEPLQVTISRIVTYHRVTEKTGVWL